MAGLRRQERIASAALSGVMENWARMRFSSREDAVADVDRALAEWKVPPSRRLAVLTDAAAAYTHDPDATGNQHYPEVLALFVELGVDRDEAAEVYRMRHSRGSGAWRV